MQLCDYDGCEKVVYLHEDHVVMGNRFFCCRECANAWCKEHDVVIYNGYHKLPVAS